MTIDPGPNSDKGVAAVLLAAGRGERFGASGAQEGKLLSEIGDKRVIDRVIDALDRSGVTRIVAVAADAPVIEALDLRARDIATPIRVVRLGGKNRALSRSLKAGIEALDETTTGALVCLADMPLVSSALIDHILEAGDAAAPAVVPVRDARWGNPVLLRRALWPEVLALDGDRGAKATLMAHEHEISFVEVDDDAIFTDIDTPKDLAGADRMLTDRKEKPDGPRD